MCCYLSNNTWNTCILHCLATQWLQAQSEGGHLATLAGCYNLSSFNHRPPPRFSSLFQTSKLVGVRTRLGVALCLSHTTLIQKWLKYLILFQIPTQTLATGDHDTALRWPGSHLACLATTRNAAIIHSLTSVIKTLIIQTPHYLALQHSPWLI